MRGGYAEGYVPRRVFLMPFWFALVFICGLLLYRLKQITRSPGRPGLCPRCGYDLRATPDGCPECGAIRETTA